VRQRIGSTFTGEGDGTDNIIVEPFCFPPAPHRSGVPRLHRVLAEPANESTILHILCFYMHSSSRSHSVVAQQKRVLLLLFHLRQSFVERLLDPISRTRCQPSLFLLKINYFDGIIHFSLEGLESQAIKIQSDEKLRFVQSDEHIYRTRTIHAHSLSSSFANSNIRINS